MHPMFEFSFRIHLPLVVTLCISVPMGWHITKFMKLFLFYLFGLNKRKHLCGQYNMAVPFTKQLHRTTELETSIVLCLKQYLQEYETINQEQLRNRGWKYGWLTEEALFRVMIFLLKNSMPKTFKCPDVATKYICSSHSKYKSQFDFFFKFQIALGQRLQFLKKNRQYYVLPYVSFPVRFATEALQPK